MSWCWGEPAGRAQLTWPYSFHPRCWRRCCRRRCRFLCAWRTNTPFSHGVITSHSRGYESNFCSGTRVCRTGTWVCTWVCWGWCRMVLQSSSWRTPCPCCCTHTLRRFIHTGLYINTLRRAEEAASESIGFGSLLKGTSVELPNIWICTATNHFLIICSTTVTEKLESVS